ncbi:MAG TPA: tRNA lysidine(34) synthetase TilS, partial [Atribacterota bacterium]|nr:tRNA lysidine(34) synthetase TilS [Atribacterota bacterium]
NETYLDYEKLKFPLKVRSRKPGDRFQPLNSSYYKKIKSFFIDQKIDRDTRDKTMLVVDNSDRIAWIAGFQTDNRFKVTNKTIKVLHIRQITI